MKNLNSTSILDAWKNVRYSLYSPVYDLMALPFRTARRAAIALLAPNPGDRVLLVGAGTGLDFGFLPPEIEITAIDRSPAMLSRARQRAEELGRQVSILPMDARQMTFADAHFDKVVVHLILSVVAEPLACVREISRILKPSGTVSILDKFLPDDQAPTWRRRALAIGADVLFSDINRQLGPLLAHGGLRIRHEQAATFGGFYKIVIAEKS